MGASSCATSRLFIPATSSSSSDDDDTVDVDGADGADEDEDEEEEEEGGPPSVDDEIGVVGAPSRRNEVDVNVAAVNVATAAAAAVVGRRDTSPDGDDDDDDDDFEKNCLGLFDDEDEKVFWAPTRLGVDFAGEKEEEAAAAAAATAARSLVEVERSMRTSWGDRQTYSFYLSLTARFYVWHSTGRSSAVEIG